MLITYILNAFNAYGKWNIFFLAYYAMYVFNMG